DAYWALNENRDVLDRLAFDLLEQETLDEQQLAALFHDVVKREQRGVWLASRDRPVSSRPPIDPPAPRAADAGPAAEPAAGPAVGDRAVGDDAEGADAEGAEAEGDGQEPPQGAHGQEPPR